MFDIHFFSLFHFIIIPIYRNQINYTTKLNILPLSKVDNEMKKMILKAMDNDKKENKTSIIYNIDCNYCEASYVGQTKRTGAKPFLNEHTMKKETVISNH